MNEGHVRIRSWDKFKQLVKEKKPPSIVFILEQNGFSPNKELTILKLILLHDKRYYIFLDFPKGEKLKETEIPLHKDRNKILHKILLFFSGFIYHLHILSCLIEQHFNIVKPNST